MRRWRVLVLVLASLAAAVAPAEGATTTTTTTAAKKKPPPSVPSTTTTTSAEAARQAAITSQLRSLREQVAEASAREASVLDALDEVAASRRSVERELADIDARLEAVTAELAGADTDLATVTADLQRAETKFVATEADLSGARTELADRAVNAYMRQPSAQLASVVLERQSLRELAAARDFLRSVAEAQVRSVERYLDLRRSISDERALLEGTRDAVRLQKDLVTARRQELVQVRERRASLRAKASSEEARQRTLLTEVRSTVKEYESEIAALKKESDAIGALLRARQKAQAKPAAGAKRPSGTGPLTAPVPGGITSTFGNRLHPIFETMRMHAGIDFAAVSGTPVRAAADGVVVAAGDRGGYGTTVIVDHDNGLATLYAHLSRAAVADGATVARGAVIGYAGSTGFSTGPHLHFEVRVNGNPVDPVRYL